MVVTKQTRCVSQIPRLQVGSKPCSEETRKDTGLTGRAYEENSLGRDGLTVLGDERLSEEFQRLGQQEKRCVGQELYLSTE